MSELGQDTKQCIVLLSCSLMLREMVPCTQFDRLGE